MFYLLLACNTDPEINPPKEDITPKTTYAWQGEISVIKNSLADIDGHIHFEYVIPRMGKRVDVLLVIQNVIS